MPARVLAAGLAAVLGAMLALAAIPLAWAPGGLTASVQESVDRSGVAHPVTAVLLAFRAYDTWLELAVLLLAALGALAVRRAADLAGAPPDEDPGLTGDPVLGSLARVLVPLAVLAAGYLLWLGAHAPGGAFQAGAVLGAAGVVLRMAGHASVGALPGWPLRMALAAGFLAFLAVALATAVAGRALLALPRAGAGALILGIEVAATLSIGLTLAALFAGAQGRGPDAP